jgi:hypothetical protein
MPITSARRFSPRGRLGIGFDSMPAAKFENPWRAFPVSISPDGKSISFWRKAGAILIALHEAGPLSISIGVTNCAHVVAMLEQKLSYHIPLSHIAAPPAFR